MVHVRGTSPHDNQRRRLRTTNAVWSIGPGQWALGAYKICQQITDTIPEDQEAVWKDADHNRFCIRPQLTIPAQSDENAQMKSRFHTRGVGIYEIGRGIIVKFKHMGMGGSSREPEAMKLIRKEAPSVPVPEVFHHWKDPTWFCYVTIMREVPGREIGVVWFALDESQKQRLAKEAADHIRAMAEIQSETAQYANQENLCDGHVVLSDYDIFVDEWAEPEQGTSRLDFKQLNEYRQANGWPLLPEAYGDRFHLCHMDLNPDHVFVSDGVTSLPDEYVYSMPLEEQAKLSICAIIDFERAGFFPKFMVTWQLQGIHRHGLANHKYGLPLSASDEFDDALIKALINLGFPDPAPIHIRETENYQILVSQGKSVANIHTKVRRCTVTVIRGVPDAGVPSTFKLEASELLQNFLLQLQWLPTSFVFATPIVQDQNAIWVGLCVWRDTRS